MAKVLVVDDHASNRELITSLLKHRGHESLEAGDGQEALAEVRAGRPDLVICDILMPTMDGYEFVRQLRADPAIAHTVVVFYTATFLEREARALAHSCGVSQVLVKPSESKAVLAAIDLALSGATPAQPLPDVAESDRQHRRVLADRLVQKADELERVNQRLSALTELNLQLASEHDPELLLDKVCRGARVLLGARFAILGVKDKSDPALTAVVTAGMPAEDAGRIKRTRIDVGMPRQVMLDRTPRRFFNPGGDPVMLGLPGDYPPVHSGLIAPIASLTQAYGWILLVDKVGAEAFSDEDERLLTIHAAQAGRIYESGSLYVEMRRSAERLRTEVAERQRTAGELRESEAGLRRAQTLARLAHVITRPDGSFESWSETLPQLIGVVPSQMPASTREWLQLLHPDDQAIFRATSVAAGASGSAAAVEYRLRRGDGEWISIHQEMEPLPGRAEANGNPRWFSTLQDVTESRRAEHRIQRLNRVYEVLSAINALIVRAHGHEELFREACRIAVEAGAYKMAWIGVLDPATQDGQVVASRGGDDGYAATVQLTLKENLPHSQRPASRAMRSMAPVISNDVAADASLVPWRAELLARGLRSQACFPLVVNQQPVGVLALYSGELNAFDEPEVKLLLELAGDISFAFDHIRKEERLNHLAYYDSLTGLANRSLLNERLEQAIGTAGAAKQTLALAMIDVERFKTINHSLGRHGGDALLVQLAQRLRQGFGARARLARLGADQFAVLIPDVRDEADIGRVFEEQHRRCFVPPFYIDGQELRISAKVGIALYPNDGGDAETLHRNAEAAVKKAKASAERVLFYDPGMTEAVAGKLALENQLRRAVEREEFVLHYQPKVDLDSHRITGVEALIRWNSPELGLVPPMKFIPLLEETRLIGEVGAWALQRATIDHAAWRGQGLDAPRVAVNVSAVQLRDPEFVDTVEAALKRGAQPHGIDLEITESLVMQDVEASIGKLQALRALGVQLAIDDFGTGYSSLAYLAELPVQILKIDRAFILTMLDKPNTLTLVSTMISLAHSLRMKVVAEGVESQEQAKMLRLLRCDQMQGYLVSPPVPFEQMSALIRNDAFA